MYINIYKRKIEKSRKREERIKRKDRRNERRIEERNKGRKGETIKGTDNNDLLVQIT